MPSVYGALTLKEMRERVWRRIDAIRHTTLSADNEEVVTDNILDPLVTKEDLNMYLATSLTMRFIDVSNASPSVYSDEKTIDIVMGQTEYPLPEDIAFLRAIYWKDTETPITLVPPSERTLMYEFNADEAKDTLLNLREAPTYRRRLGLIVLNQVPRVDNPSGLLVEYVKQILLLVDDEQYLEFPLANMFQEVMIADATIEIIEERMHLDASMIKTTRDTKLDRLILAASMQKMPKSIQLLVNSNTFAQPQVRRWRRQ